MTASTTTRWRPSLEPKTIEPGDKSYANVRSTYLRSGSPGLVIQPER